MRKFRIRLVEQGNEDDEILNKIDWDGLSSEISHLIHVSPLTVTPYISRNGQVAWKVEEELVSYAGLFKVALSSVWIGSAISSSVYDIKEKNYYWCSGYIIFRMKDGGENMMPLLDAWYDLNKREWTFRSVEEKYR